MTTVLLIVHLLVAAALVAVILMQRSEGGALGIGGGPGGMMSGRGAANLLTRTTMILGAVFVINSIFLAIVSGVDATGRSVFDEEQIEEGSDTIEGLFGDAFTQEGGELPAVPDGEAPTEEDTPAVPSEEPAEEPDSPEVPGR
ncbi:preprotein translocase subunit SecG [Marinicauda algicola]|uniref:Protein-export membrane protein SecG n=1 Tax=Marinicauda algicola TaxID=2029849 RepID=A0A4S2GWN3_9PROT|nr:preprotein translocase subunit SecG [Marinicauda algicola]TGY87433.1 preprotein translocase subunit SecG [Marinicauda algicola]